MCWGLEERGTRDIWGIDLECPLGGNRGRSLEEAPAVRPRLRLSRDAPVAAVARGAAQHPSGSGAAAEGQVGQPRGHLGAGAPPAVAGAPLTDKIRLGGGAGCYKRARPGLPLPPTLPPTLPATPSRSHADRRRPEPDPEDLGEGEGPRGGFWMLRPA